MDAFIISSLPPRVVGRLLTAGSPCSRSLLRFIANTDPSATLSPFDSLPLFTVIESTLLQKFLPGTRRASPVARHALVTVLSLPPRRSELAVPISFRLIMLPSPYGWGLGLRGLSLSGPPVRSLSLRPGDSLTVQKTALSMGFR